MCYRVWHEFTHNHSINHLGGITCGHAYLFVPIFTITVHCMMSSLPSFTVMSLHSCVPIPFQEWLIQCSPSLEHPCVSTFCACITGTLVLPVSPHVYPLHFYTIQWLLWLSRIILFSMVLPQVPIPRMVVPWLVLTSFQFNDGFMCLKSFSLKVFPCVLPTYHHPSLVSQIMISPFSEGSASTCVFHTSLFPSFWS